MSLDLVEIVTALDRDEDVHLARIIVLLKAFSRPDLPAIEGITKLAKLDFLLRYPSCLEKALIARGVAAKNIPVDDFERLTIEARMIRVPLRPVGSSLSPFPQHSSGPSPCRSSHRWAHNPDRPYAAGKRSCGEANRIAWILAGI